MNAQPARGLVAARQGDTLKRDAFYPGESAECPALSDNHHEGQQRGQRQHRQSAEYQIRSSGEVAGARHQKRRDRSKDMPLTPRQPA